MKINIEIDLTPEEAREFLGLPNIRAFQEKMVDQFAQRLDASNEQREEFVKSMFETAMEPWQVFGKMFGAQGGGSKTPNKPE
ncbi:MAG: DUF6489 family protein [Pseudomonadota bacterium]